MSFFRTALRELPPTLKLALPITAGQVGQMLLGVTDTIMVGQVGTLPLAACSFANSMIMVVAIAGYGVFTAVSVRVSHAHGAGAAESVARSLHAGVGLAVVFGLAAALFFHLVYPLFHHFGQAPGVVEEARAYTLIVAWSLLPSFAVAVFRNYFDSQSRPWPAFWILLGGVFLNVALNWVLIYGKFGVPALGLTGAGVATLISRIATMAGLVWLIWGGPARPSHRWSFDGALLSEHAAMLRLGLPAGLTLLGEVGAFSVAAILIGKLGAVPLAAHQIAITCASTSFMFPLGVAMASTVRIAQASGAGRHHLLRPIAAGSWALGVGVMAAFAVLLLLANRPIAAAFVRDEEVISIAASLLVVAGIFQLVDGVQVVGSGLLRGLRDATGPMVITVAAYWVVALPLGTWLAFRGGMGAQGMWTGLALGLGVAAVLLVKRFLNRTSQWLSA
ncbi:MAG: MATE family efflux transporter [Chthoniobacterales bacterium]|nr:MATE family efflux transporter [Chthoniobacterales bacterium]